MRLWPLTEEELLNAARESSKVEFKDLGSLDDDYTWCSIIKDIVAMTNTGGGGILFGVDDNGRPTGRPVTEILKIDPADITNRINRYTGAQFAEFEIKSRRKGKREVALMLIGVSRPPIVFSKQGSYRTADGKDKAVFGAGTIYFRHGAKSEPADAHDLPRAIERMMKDVRKELLSGLRKLVAGVPSTGQVGVISGKIDEGGAKVSISQNPNAPQVRIADVDSIWPYRQIEVAKIVAKAVGDNRIRPYEIQCVRAVYGIDERDDFTLRQSHASKKFSHAFVRWLTERYRKDPEFFAKARDDYRAKTRRTI